MSQISVFHEIRAAIDRGELDGAEALLAARGHEIKPWERLTQTYRLAHTRRDHRTAEAVAREALASRPGSPSSHDMLAFALNNQGRYYEGMVAAEAGMAIAPDDPRLIDRAQRAARALGMPGKAIDLLERLAELSPEPARRYAEIATLSLQLYRGQAALENLERALEAGHERAPLLVDLATACERARRFERAEDYWVEIEALGGPDAELAGPALARIRTHLKVERAQNIGPEGLEALFALTAEEPMTLPGRDLTAWRRTASRDMVLVFGGLQAMMGVAPPSAPEVLLRDHAVNVLSFSDTSQRLMLGGIPSLAPDYEGTLAMLARLFEAWGVERVHVLGYSAGGYSALRYAVDLRARRLMLMGGSIAIPPGSDGALVASLLRRVGRMYMDARDYVERLGAGTSIVAAYGADNEADAWQARRLEGLPNVRMRPMAGISGHSLAVEPVHDDLVGELFDAGYEASRASA